MTDDSPGDDVDGLDGVESGLNALTLVEVARDVLEAVDVEALENGASVVDAVDETAMRDALGGPAGRIVARELADRVTGGGVTGLVGREIAGRAGASLVEYLIETFDAESIGAALEGMDEQSFESGASEDATVIDIDADEGEDGSGAVDVGTDGGDGDDDR
jgi:hypothetical protein